MGAARPTPTQTGSMAQEPAELLTPTEMAVADRTAIERGTPSITLMETAGNAVAARAHAMVPAGSIIVVLCGPGNNGGDGFIAAQDLARRGHAVELFLIGDKGSLKGDAARAADQWKGESQDLSAHDQCKDAIGNADLVIDALFGGGLTRPISGDGATVIGHVNTSGKPVVAVDVPSGLDGATGQPLGPVMHATASVTFFRKKPGHLLFPGRQLCGDIDLVDIGIPAGVLEYVKPQTWENTPNAPWGALLLRPDVAGHKYNRGHVAVVSGPAHATGAARLAARGALRLGAGLVTMLSTADAVPVHAAHLTAIMLQEFEGPEGITAALSDTRKNAAVIGPGFGVGEATCRTVEAVLKSGAATVLDADGLTSFEGNLSRLAAALAEKPSRPVVMTPHDGEYARLFGDVPGSRLQRARHAAAESGAIVILKGPDTVIAAPDRRALINACAPPWLATAGSGDVLAGFVAALLAQGMPGFEAAGCAVWVHSQAAARFGPGLIAEDLPEQAPQILSELYR